MRGAGRPMTVGSHLDGGSVDTATARRLIAPDFQLINPGGGVSSREDYMDAIKAGVIDYRVFEPSSPIAVRLSGDSAALR
jgi:uncharacterized protein DUF4440